MARRTQEEKYRDAKATAMAWAEWSKALPAAKEKAFEAAKNSPVRFILGNEDDAAYSEFDIVIVDTTRPRDKNFRIVCWCDDQDDADLILSALNKVYPEKPREGKVIDE